MSKMGTSRKQALADYLEVDESDLVENGSFGGFNTKDGASYLVLDEDEARNQVAEEIKSTLDDMGLMAFTESAREMILENFVDGWEEDVDDSDEYEDFEDFGLSNFGKKWYNDDTVLAIAMNHLDFDAVVDFCIRNDGRGHFISYYDGEEGESGDWLIYRVD